MNRLKPLPIFASLFGLFDVIGAGFLSFSLAVVVAIGFAGVITAVLAASDAS